jgi:hypothetical protein
MSDATSFHSLLNVSRSWYPPKKGKKGLACVVWTVVTVDSKTSYFDVKASTGFWCISAGPVKEVGTRRPRARPWLAGRFRTVAWQLAVIQNPEDQVSELVQPVSSRRLLLTET